MEIKGRVDYYANFGATATCKTLTLASFVMFKRWHFGTLLKCRRFKGDQNTKNVMIIKFFASYMVCYSNQHSFSKTINLKK